MDDFTEAYIECALWSSNDASTLDGGEPIDLNYDEGDLDPQTRDAMVADCKRFQRANSDDIDTWEGCHTTCDEQAGHDFWLTRNGHGCGFWEIEWDGGPGSRLDRASEAFGEYNLYVENGKVYGESC